MAGGRKYRPASLGKGQHSYSDSLTEREQKGEKMSREMWKMFRSLDSHQQKLAEAFDDMKE